MPSLPSGALSDESDTLLRFEPASGDSSKMMVVSMSTGSPGSSPCFGVEAPNGGVFTTEGISGEELLRLSVVSLELSCAFDVGGRSVCHD